MPSKLAADLLHFTETVDQLNTPEAVLDTLDAITWCPCHAHVLGAALIPLNFGNSDSLVIGKTVFLHKSVPKGWWEERAQLATRSPAPMDVVARLALSAFSFSEMMKILEPIGIDRWAVDLNMKHGMRDAFNVPNRWPVDFRLLVAKGYAAPAGSTLRKPSYAAEKGGVRATRRAESHRSSRRSTGLKGRSRGRDSWRQRTNG